MHSVHLLATVSGSLCFLSWHFPVENLYFQFVLKSGRERIGLYLIDLLRLPLLGALTRHCERFRRNAFGQQCYIYKWGSLFITGTGSKGVERCAKWVWASWFVVSFYRLFFFLLNDCVICFNQWEYNSQVTKGQLLSQEFVNLIWPALTRCYYFSKEERTLMYLGLVDTYRLVCSAMMQKLIFHLGFLTILASAFRQAASNLLKLCCFGLTSGTWKKLWMNKSLGCTGNFHKQKNCPSIHMVSS